MVVSLILSFYFLYLAIHIIRIPNENWESYKKFNGSGVCLKIDKDGNFVSYKYKTTEDVYRLLKGIKQ